MSIPLPFFKGRRAKKDVDFVEFSLEDTNKKYSLKLTREVNPTAVIYEQMNE